MLPKLPVRQCEVPRSPLCSVGSIFDQSVVTNGISDICIVDFLGEFPALSNIPLSWAASHGDAPGAKLLSKGHRGVGRTRGRKASVADRTHIQIPQHVSFEASPCCRTVEKHM